MIALNFGFGALEGEFWRLLFAMTRIGAALVAAPFFGGETTPPQLRVVLAGAVAVLICAWLPPIVPPAMLSAAGLLAVAGEVLVGLALGFVLQLAFTAPIIAAEVIGGAMGMSMATSVDPSAGVQSPALGQYFRIVLTLIFLAMGGHLRWFALLVDSYRVFPPGHTWLGPDVLLRIAGFAGEMFATAVTMALPVTLVLFVVQLLTGVLSRSAPALNLFAMGLPATVLGGIAALVASAPLVTDQMTDLAGLAVGQVQAVLAAPAPAEPGR